MCAFTCFENTRSIKLVTREEDGRCFLCGDTHPQDADFFRVVGMGYLLDRDKSLAAIENLQVNWEAERKNVGDDWIIGPMTAD